MYIRQQVPGQPSRVESKAHGDSDNGDVLEVSFRLFPPPKRVLMTAQLEVPSNAPAQLKFDYDEVGSDFILTLLSY